MSATLAPLLSLSGRRALVAGGGGGIGTAVVELFESAGAEVIAVDREFRGSAGRARCIEADLSQAGEVEALYRRLDAEGAAPDVLVHAVGITRDRMLWKLADDDWTSVLRTNLDSAFWLLRGAVPAMRARGGGAIVLVSSINGERGKIGQANYAASKAGMIGLARTAARELGRFGVRVNVVAPGLVRTALTAALPAQVVEAALAESALGRAAEPEDVARAALFLCTELSRHVTGQVLRVDGGQCIA